MTKVYMIEALPIYLSSYPESLSNRALEDLKNLQVEVILNKKVTDINENGLRLMISFIETKIFSGSRKIRLYL